VSQTVKDSGKRLSSERIRRGSLFVSIDTRQSSAMGICVATLSWEERPSRAGTAQGWYLCGRIGGERNEMWQQLADEILPVLPKALDHLVKNTDTDATVRSLGGLDESRVQLHIVLVEMRHNAVRVRLGKLPDAVRNLIEQRVVTQNLLFLSLLLLLIEVLVPSDP
jgi:hypothetical protein